MKPCHGVMSRILVVLVALLSVSEVLAEPGMFSPVRVGRFYWFAGAGGYFPDANAQLGDQEGKYGFLVGGGYRTSENFAWEMDFLVGHQNVNTPASIVSPFFGTVDPRSSLDTSGISGTAKYIYPVGRLEPYAGGGIGIYTVKFKATGQQLGVPVDLTHDVTGLGVHLMAGADYLVTDKTSLGIEFRNVRVKAGLGNIIPGEIDVGGNFLSLILRSTI